MSHHIFRAQQTGALQIFADGRNGTVINFVIFGSQIDVIRRMDINGFYAVFFYPILKIFAVSSLISAIGPPEGEWVKICIASQPQFAGQFRRVFNPLGYGNMSPDIHIPIIYSFAKNVRFTFMSLSIGIVGLPNVGSPRCLRF